MYKKHYKVNNDLFIYLLYLFLNYIQFSIISYIFLYIFLTIINLLLYYFFRD